MKASVVDLRYRMAEVLNALDKRELVQILSHGKLKGVIHPPDQPQAVRAAEHAFFGMCKDHTEPVDRVMDRLRGGRYSAL